MIRLVRALRRGGAVLALGALLGTGAAAQVLLYVPAQSANQVWEYGITPSTGSLNNFPAQSTAGGEPKVIAVSPNNRFMYVGSQDGSIDAFVANFDGTLTRIAPPLANAGSVRGLAIEPSGRFLYAANPTGGDIRVFSINAQTGALIDLLPLTVSLGATSQPRGIVTDNAGHLYVVMSGPHTVAQFTISSTTGALTQIAAPIDTGTTNPDASPDRIVINPSGTLAYVANQMDTSIQGYTITPGTGALVLNGPPVNTGSPSRPTGLAIHPNGQLLIAAMSSPSRTTDNVVVYRIGATGALTQIATGAAGNQATGVTITPAGDYVYVSNFGSASITKFTLNPATGALTAPATFATGTSPQFLISRLAPDPPPNIPTVSPWTLCALVVLLAGSAAFVLRREYR